MRPTIDIAREAARRIIPLPMAQADYACKPPIPAHVRQLQVNRWHEESVERVAAIIASLLDAERKGAAL